MDSFNEMKTRIKVKIKIKGGVCLLGENFRFVPVVFKGEDQDDNRNQNQTYMMMRKVTLGPR